MTTGGSTELLQTLQLGLRLREINSKCVVALNHATICVT